LQPRDVIRGVNTSGVTTLQGLREAVRALPAGAAVTLQIQRGGRLMFVAFTRE
jgi:S1-C subfamily serine protease